MKKILFFCLVVLITFLIYISNMDKKVYYLALGDSMAYGLDAYGNNSGGYAIFVNDYLKDKGILETYVNEFSQKGQRIYDLINDIESNKEISIDNKKITLQNSLIKADLVTLSIGANDILNKINDSKSLDYDSIYNYIDTLSFDLEKLLKLIRMYCKEDIFLVGYYNPYDSNKEIIDYLNKKYKDVCKEYNVLYIDIDDIFDRNKNFLLNDDIHPTQDGYHAIALKIIESLDKTVLKS